MASSKRGLTVCGLALLMAGCSANARFDMSEYQDPNAARPVDGTSTASLPQRQAHYTPSYPPAAYQGSTASIPPEPVYGYRPSYPPATYTQGPSNAPWANQTNTASIPTQRSYGYNPSTPPAVYQSASRAPASTASLGTATDALGAGSSVHVVRQGDTLWSLSRRYNVPVSQIYSANGLLNDKLTPGQHLTIPAGARSASVTPRYASN